MSLKKDVVMALLSAASSCLLLKDTRVFSTCVCLWGEAKFLLFAHPPPPSKENEWVNVDLMTQDATGHNVDSVVVITTINRPHSCLWGVHATVPVQCQ